jgi:inner membrane protein
MDSLTHIAIGICVGEAFFEKGFGKKALLWGILAQSIPDIDFISALWLNTPQYLLAHRGFSHSILFCLLATILFSLAADRFHRPHNITFKKWMAFFFTEIILHLIIDGLNNYGTGYFEPFSHQRFSLNAVYVADPLFSIITGYAAFRLIYLNAYHQKRRFWWRIGLISPIIYILISVMIKYKINNDIQKDLAMKQINHVEFSTTPAPLQNLLWYVVAENKDGYYTTYRSVFSNKIKNTWHYFKKNEESLSKINDHEELQLLKRFSQHKYTIESKNGQLWYNDVRFGQTNGWENPKADFVFHYILQHPGENTIIIQKGRFAKWNWETTQSLFKRIWHQ